MEQRLHGPLHKQTHHWIASSITCAGHVTKLVAKEGLTVPTANRTIIGGMKIVGHFGHFTKLQNDLNKLQVEMSKPQHHLIQGVMVR